MKTLEAERGRIGKRGTLVIASTLREEYGLADGQDVIQEPTLDGILIRAAISVPIRRYSNTDKAAFLLNSTSNAKEYAEAVAEVKSMGLDPKKIQHRKPR